MKAEKIFASEQLSDEDLEKVVGGSAEELADDSRFLNVLLGGNVIDRWGSGFAIQHISEIKNAWDKVGVTLKVGTSTANVGREGTKTNYTTSYFIGSQEITQSQARKHAMKFTRKILDITDWQW